MVQTQNPLGRGHFRPGVHHLNKPGKGPLENATYDFQASKPSSSGEKDFVSIFHFRTEDPRRAVFDLRATT